LSLFMDGVTAGLQKRLQRQTAANPPTAYDFLVFTNLAMIAVALSISLTVGDFWAGQQFLKENPACVKMVLSCCLCSAIGQAFVFYVITTFDPFVLSIDRSWACRFGHGFGRTRGRD
jgi:drug/metabolite transporter (DMT)-like permease